MPESVAHPRRRFPLTLTALGLSAVAIPLYLVSMCANESATVDQPVFAAEHASDDVRTADAAKVATGSTAVAKAEPAPARSDAAVVAPLPASPPPSAEPTSGKRKGSRTRRPMGSAVDGEMAGDMAGGMGGEMAGDMTVALEEGRGGFDEQLQANVLTAGRTSDLVDRRSLDELRAKATRQDPVLAQAIVSHDRAGASPSPGTAPNVLEIGFVLDTTGSMGDELSYLKVEMRSIAAAIAQEFPGVQQRYALVAYRDHGDAYVVRNHDFEPLDAFVEHLGSEHAGGGGDHPEAMDEAMQTATELGWSSPSAAQMLFLVADAPPHAASYPRYVSATESLAGRDISVYPVASSGVETVCEYVMRWAARTTGGEYIFLTDHSGIGNPHADPHVDQYELKTLREHMLEVIRIELGAGQVPEQRADQFCGLHHGQQDRPTWWDRHGLFVFVLGATFLFGFAGDTVISQLRARRDRA